MTSLRGGFAVLSCLILLAGNPPSSLAIDANRVYIGPDTSQWSEYDIVQVFVRSGLYEQQAALLYANLLDYVDADCVPADLGSACTERVPMINEIRFQPYLIYLNGTTCRPAFAGKIECFYPFETSTTNRFNLAYEVYVSAGPGMTAPSVFIPPSSSGVISDIYHGARYGNVSIPIIWTDVPDCSWADGMSVQLTVRVGLKVVNQQTGAVVDAVPWPYATSSFLALTLTNLVIHVPSSSPTIGAPSGYECFDPRFNWKAAAYWFRYGYGGFPTGSPTNGSIGAANYVSTNIYTAIQLKRDRDDYMHVADGPLQSVGELGFLCFDQWQTVRLYATNPGAVYHPVLDHFSLSMSPSDDDTTNVNSCVQASLAAVLDHMPRREFSWDGTREELTSLEAQDLADFIIANGPYESVGELGKLNWMAAPGLVGSRADREVIGESLIRNTAPYWRTTRRITLDPASNGQMQTDGALFQPMGSNTAVDVFADPGYHIGGLWEDDLRRITGGDSTPVNFTWNDVYEDGDEDCTLRAVFDINRYAIMAAAGGWGTISPSGRVMIAHGSETNFTIKPDPYYHISEITTSRGPVTGPFDMPFTYTWGEAETNGRIVAIFDENTTVSNVPEWWLAQYKLTNFVQDAVADKDGDGVPGWQEYEARSDPTNLASVFKITSMKIKKYSPTKNRCTITWSSPYNESRPFYVVRGTNLSRGLVGFNTSLTTNKWYLPSGCAHTDTVSSVGAYYYKIRVNPGPMRVWAIGQIRKALAEYYVEYGSYPPVTGVYWEYTDPLYSPQAPPDAGLGGVTGLAYYLCSDEIAGRYRWSNYVSGVKSGPWTVPHTGNNANFGFLSWSNQGVTLEGEFGVDLNYMSSTSRQSYLLW